MSHVTHATHTATHTDMTDAQAKYIMAAVALIEEAEQVKNRLDSMNESRHMNESWMGRVMSYI